MTSLITDSSAACAGAAKVKLKVAQRANVPAAMTIRERNASISGEGLSWRVQEQGFGELAGGLMD